LIQTQPAATNVPLGSEAVFSLSAAGTWPLSYQWQLNGVNLANSAHISGANSNLLRIANAGYADLSNYSVIITNGYGIGAVTSSVAALQVLGTNLLANGGLELPAQASNTVGVLAPTGWSNTTYIVNGSPYPRYGPFDTRYPPGPPMGLSDMNVGPSPQEGQQCVDLQGGNLTQNCTNLNPGQFELSWYDNTPISDSYYDESAYSVSLLDAANQLIVSNLYNAFRLDSFQGPTWQRQSVIIPLPAGTNTVTFQQLYYVDNGGTYGPSLDTLLDNVALRAVLVAPSGMAPNIVSQPLSQSAIAGASANFSVTASGTSPLSYQWQFNTTNLADTPRITGSSSNSLTLAPVLPGDAGGYSVVVTNSSGLATSTIANLTVLLPPLSVALTNGNAALAFTMNTLSGYAYQLQYKTNLASATWLNAGNPLTATNATLTMTELIGPDPQRYYRMTLSP
jgi:hypothetical protein